MSAAPGHPAPDLVAWPPSPVVETTATGRSSGCSVATSPDFPDMSPPLIELAGLSQSYGTVQALSGLSGSIPHGSIGLVGANGAGKSTLIKVLLGILKPSEGGASVLGLSVTDETLAMRARVGYMPERGGLPPDQTAADFMIYAAELAGIPHKAAIVAKTWNAWMSGKTIKTLRHGENEKWPKILRPTKTKNDPCITREPPTPQACSLLNRKRTASRSSVVITAHDSSTAKDCRGNNGERNS